MSLSSLYLDAFFEVCKTRNFSIAAQNLAITQSALSQRVANLELELGVSLLLREKGNFALTELGEKLLSYCQLRESVESEVLTSILSQNSDIKGELRVAGYSTIIRSAVIPALAPLFFRSPAIQLEIMTKEVRDIVPMVKSGEAHFGLINYSFQKQGWICQQIGGEEYILIEAKIGKGAEGIYIDHDKEDTTTYDFFKSQKKMVAPYQRIFLDEIYAIIDAVSLGLGRAVVPKHLIQGSAKVNIVKGFKSYHAPIFLCYKERVYYTELQKSFLSCISKNFSQYINKI